MLIMTLVGFLVSVYGILQYFGIEPLLKGYHYIPHIPFSTLGHRNQVAQYLVLLIPLSGVFFFLTSSWAKAGCLRGQHGDDDLSSCILQRAGEESWGFSSLFLLFRWDRDLSVVIETFPSSSGGNGFFPSASSC